MAYSSTALNCVSMGPLATGFKEWVYSQTTDSIATILGASYVSDATKKGLAKGDYVLAINATAPWAFMCQVASISSGAATLQLVASAVGGNEVATALSTVGAGTITAAGIVGGVTTRGGAQSATAFTDTTDTAANIIAALPNPAIGRSFEYVYVNTTDGAATLSGGTGVTVSGITVVPALSVGRFLVTYTAAATVTMVGLSLSAYSGGPGGLPASKVTSISAGNGTLSAGDMEGAAFTYLASSGATAMTTRTAAQIIAGIPGAGVGTSYILRVRNTNGGTLTLTGGSGVTISGTATIATTVWRDYRVLVATASTITMTDIGSGAA